MMFFVVVVVVVTRTRTRVVQVCDACSKERHPRHPHLRICTQCLVRNEHRSKVKNAPRDAPVAVKIGFMEKRGKVNKSFAKRLFLLDSNGNLVYVIPHIIVVCSGVPCPY